MASDILAELAVKIGTDLSGLEQGLKSADSKMKSFSQTVMSHSKQIGMGMTVAGGAITGMLGLATKSAMDAVESENLFTVALGNNAKAAQDWSEQLSNSLGLNEYELRKNVATFYQMTSSMGIAENESLNLSKGLTELAYDMASFYNLQPEEAFLKLQAGITGEAEPLKRLGILIDETTIKTHALTTGMIKEGEELTQTQKVLARYHVIMNQTANAQGDLARTLESPTNRLRVLSSQMDELKIKIGEALLPVLSKILDKIMPVVEGIAKWVQENPQLAGTITIAVAALGGLMTVLGPLFMILPGITAALPILGAAFAALTGPVGIAIAAIAALIAIGVAVWKNWDTISTKATEIWNGIAGFFKGVWDRITGIFKEHWDKILAILFPPIGIPVLMARNWEAVKTATSTAWNAIAGFFRDVWDRITGVFREHWDKILAILFPPVGIPVLIARNWEQIVGIVRGIFDRVAGAIRAPIEAVVNWFSGIVDWFRQMASTIGGFFNFGGGSSFRGSVPAYQHGGVVPGTGPQLAMVHGGETIIPAGAAAGLVINLNVAGSVVSERELTSMIREEFLKLKRRNTSTGF